MNPTWSFVLDLLSQIFVTIESHARSQAQSAASAEQSAASTQPQKSVSQ